MVAEVIRETPDTATLVLFTGNDRLQYEPGHFLTIDPHQFPALERFLQYFEEAKGKREPARAYSIASAPHEPYLAITVKEEYYISGVTRYPPLLSPLLVWRTQPGTRMTITGFGGPYVLPRDIESRTDHLVHVCAGSGIVPNWSIMNHALATGLELRHTLIFGNKTRDDIIFRSQLDELTRKYPDRVQVLHTLSREADVSSYGPAYRPGRVGKALIAEAIPDPTAVQVFACGPAVGRWERLAAREEGTEPQPRFLETVIEALSEIGVPADRIRKESYG
jgi:ferredoxin-NADP reductase